MKYSGLGKDWREREDKKPSSGSLYTELSYGVLLPNGELIGTFYIDLEPPIASFRRKASSAPTENS